MLPAKHRLTQKTDFSSVYANGSYVAAENISIKYLRSKGHLLRIGFPIGKNFSKKATARNRARRVIRAAASEYLLLLKPGFDIVIMVKPTAEKIELPTVLTELKKVFLKANLLI